MHVIVCSKNTTVVGGLAEVLDAQGHRMTVCESGMETLGAVQVVDPDLLILDMEMPGLNGLLLVAAIKELAPDLPVVAVSPRSEADARALAQRGVACATLPAAGEGGAAPVLAALAEIGRARPVSSASGS